MIGTFSAGRPAGVAGRAWSGHFRSENVLCCARDTRRRIVSVRVFILPSPVESVPRLSDRVDPVLVFGIWLQSGRKQRER